MLNYIINSARLAQLAKDTAEASVRSTSGASEPNSSEPPVKTIPVLIPVRRVRLTVNHVLLSGLGGISRFLLRVLNHDAGTLSLFREVTGLREDEYGPLLERLVSLGLVTEGTLTTQGKRVAHILSSLHGKSVSVWMDEAFSQNTIIFNDDKLILKDASSSEERLVIPRDKSPVAYKRMKVNAVLDQHGEVFLSGITGVPIDKENSRMSDWVLEIDIEGEDGLGYVETSFTPDKMDASVKLWSESISFAIPHLVIERRSFLPNFLVERKVWKEPEVDRLGFNFFNKSLIDSDGLCGFIDDPRELLKFPVISSNDEDEAIAVIVDKLLEYKNVNDSLMNVDHDFSFLFQVIKEPVYRIVEKLMILPCVYGSLKIER